MNGFLVFFTFFSAKAYAMKSSTALFVATSSDEEARFRPVETPVFSQRKPMKTHHNLKESQ